MAGHCPIFNFPKAKQFTEKDKIYFNLKWSGISAQTDYGVLVKVGAFKLLFPP
jgi:hypothetical protein